MDVNDLTTPTVQEESVPGAVGPVQATELDTKASHVQSKTFEAENQRLREENRQLRLALASQNVESNSTIEKTKEQEENSGVTVPAKTMEETKKDKENSKRSSLHDSCSNCEDVTRLIIVGRTGSGISSLANQIRGLDHFNVALSASSVTERSKSDKFYVNGKQVILVETPGFCHTKLTTEEIKTEILHGMSMTQPGPHAVLFAYRMGRSFDEDKESIEQLTKIMGEDILKFVIVVFTFKDTRSNQTIDDYVNRLPTYFKDFFSKFDERVLTFNYSDNPQESDVQSSLFSCIDKMEKRNQQDEYFHISGQTSIDSCCSRLKSCCTFALCSTAPYVTAGMISLCTFGVFVLIPLFYQLK